MAFLYVFEEGGVGGRERGCSCCFPVLSRDINEAKRRERGCSCCLPVLTRDINKAKRKNVYINITKGPMEDQDLGFCNLR